MKKIFTILLLVFSGVLGWSQTAVFVSADGNDNNNGSSWGAAKKTIAAGITAAGGNGTVYVMAGQYDITAQLVIPTGVSVKGGYGLTSSGTDTTRRDLPGTNSRWENASICTIITGNGGHRIASVSGLLEGCVARRGYHSVQGGGVLIDGGTVRYCVIRECDAYNESTLLAEGGGAYILNGGTLTNSVITECRADKGPAVSGGNGSLINNTITRNWPTHCGTVADYDGNVYNTVVIGNQCWTRQNLRSTHYNDGTAIPQGSANSETDPFYYSNYMLTSTTLVNYGYLYNWPAVMHGSPSSNNNPSGVTGICPTGWHVPSDAEWTEMTNFVNSINRYRCNGYDWQIAKALSSKTGWNSSSTECQVGNDQASNNVTLFTAYPAGYYNSGYADFGVQSCWWTATGVSSPNARYRYFFNNSNSVNNSIISGAYGFSIRCVKHLGTTPMVHTNPIPNVNVQSTIATGGGSCHCYGDSSVTYGVCWSTSHNPTVNDAHTTDGNGDGAFNSAITGLMNGTTYYVRAYAIYSGGVVYGEEVSFTADDCGDPNSLTDYDGNTYNSVRIGTQCWMKENLRTTHYADGTAITLTSTSTSSSYPYRYYPNNVANNVGAYGYLYNWAAVMKGAASSDANPSGVQGVCPAGWHVPSAAEWGQMVDFVRSQSEYLCNDNTNNIAKAMAATTGWNSSTTDCAVGNTPSANNATGFGAMPAGYMTGSFYNFGSYAFFGTSKQSESNTSHVNIYYTTSSSTNVSSTTYTKTYAFSVRCIRNN